MSLKHSDWPSRLWIVRHGQSAGNAARDDAEAQGLTLIDIQTRDADTPLSYLGQQQSLALAHWFAAQPRRLQPDVFYSSPFVRSVDTCRTIAAELNRDQVEIGIDERLREKEFGVLDRYTRQGIIATFPELAEQRERVGKFYFRPPGGESWCDVILRLRSIVEVMRRDHVGDRVLIVAHQVIVNCFRYLLECLDERAILEIDAEADVPNCAVTEYALDGWGEHARFSLQRANFVAPELVAEAEVTRAPDQPTGPK